MNTADSFIWRATVQNHELDFQHIVNNSVYLQYFERARTDFFLTKNLDVKIWHEMGFDAVIVHVDISFKHPLKADDEFYIVSTYQQSGKLKMIFSQQIYKKK